MDISSNQHNLDRELLALDVRNGLHSRPRRLSSQYLYDARGDELFQKIMRLPEYYPTNAEYEIFQQQSPALSDAFPRNEHFELVELGAGDGYKTKLLLHHLLKQGFQFTYVPIDISSSVLDFLQESLEQELPDLKVRPQQGEYHSALQKVRERAASIPWVMLFLGGNVGNFTYAQAQEFYRKLAEITHPGDLLISGLDLKKDPRIILKAYDDDQGITAAFNLNLLKRINRDLGADFKLQDWQHFPSYDPQSGECRSFLVSRRDQSVKIAQLKEEFYFPQAEAIQTEVSRKYDLPEIEALAQATGWAVREQLRDSRNYFVNTIWSR